MYSTRADRSFKTKETGLVIGQGQFQYKVFVPWLLEYSIKGYAI